MNGRLIWDRFKFNMYSGIDTLLIIFHCLLQVFRKARNKAKEEINKQLDDFKNKRTAGLGSMFGPPDNQLEESINDPHKQLKIVEEYLLPRLGQF